MMSACAKRRTMPSMATAAAPPMAASSKASEPAASAPAAEAGESPSVSATSQWGLSKSDDESCSKCVAVLRQLISNIGGSSTAPTGSADGEDSAPLTLLKAIANGVKTSSSSASTAIATSTSTATQKQQQQSGDQANLQTQQQQKQRLEIEDIPNGVRVMIPVATTDPSLLRRYSSLLREDNDDDDASSSHDLRIPLATSILRAGSKDSSVRTTTSTNAAPAATTTASNIDNLEIEFKCKKCSSVGPEGGARAFLMGPQPLSIVLCQNRIHSDVEEVTEILTHELVHLYDLQTLQLDLRQCENLAYSEIRAATQAECKNTWSQLKGLCVKQKAIRATKNVFPAGGRSCVQHVFSRAYDDQRPFAEK